VTAKVAQRARGANEKSCSYLVSLRCSWQQGQRTLIAVTWESSRLLVVHLMSQQIGNSAVE